MTLPSQIALQNSSNVTCAIVSSNSLFRFLLTFLESHALRPHLQSQLVWTLIHCQLSFSKLVLPRSSIRPVQLRHLDFHFKVLHLMEQCLIQLLVLLWQPHHKLWSAQPWLPWAKLLDSSLLWMLHLSIEIHYWLVAISQWQFLIGTH